MTNIKLRSFLSEGNIIRTKHCNSSNWVTNYIYAINEDYIEIDIGLEHNYLENIIMVGDTMKCKYTTDEREYMLIAWVSRIKAEYPQSITIKVHEVSEFDNKRDSYRYDVYLCSVIRPKNNDGKGIFAVLVNMSRTGAAFVVKEELEKQINVDGSVPQETECDCEIYISATEKISFNGIFKRKNSNEKGFEYGVKVTNIDNESRKIYDKFIDELENKDKEFYNKRSSFWSQHSKYNK